jgi:glyoxylase-like metal-dependent hydrolase (beta-lactamase superfamily II)
MPVVRDLPRDAGFTEIADRVWVARHAWFDVNVSVVAGERGLLVIDTHASEPAARSVIEDLGRSIGREVVAVMNTHKHFDHTFGNGAFRAAYPGVPLIAHEDAAADTVPAGERIKRLYDEDPDDVHRDEVQTTEIVPADTTFSSVYVVDLGDRAVELVHPGLGHTSGDVVARVEDADVLFAGDLVEESAERGGVPGYSLGSHPMAWPLTLDLVLSLVAPDTVVVPGHGNPVDRDFVQEQRHAIGVVAETIRDLAGRGVPVDQALEAGDWPYPREELADAVRRGYEELPRASKHLPLI